MIRHPASRAFGALALLLAACSPTDADPDPQLTGPDEVLGSWESSHLVCSIPLTIDAARPIRIVEGHVRLVFPAVGDPKADAPTDFSEDEMRSFWGAELEGATTRSLETLPPVQNEDYEATVRFRYTWEDRSGEEREGELAHLFHCLEDPEEAGNGDGSAGTRGG